MSLDVARIRADFPLLSQEVHGRPIVYLDSANTSQKPQSVIDTMARYYETINANVHRGTYKIAEEATLAMEGARRKVASFIGANSTREVVFTKNATEAINLVAYTWARANLNEGDAIVVSHMEHHANIVPWHMLAAERGVELRWIPVTADGLLDLSTIDELLDGAKLLAVSAMSNVLGTINPIKELAARAKAAGATVLADGSQLVPHAQVDVADLGVDFFAFTGHKMLGPTGIGVLWGREELLEAMPPFLGGGEMILNVTTSGFTTNELPWKFEGGTPPIAEIVGLGAAVDYLEAVGMGAIREHEVSLTSYALRTLTSAFGDGIQIHGPSEPALRGGVLSFTFQDVHPHDVTQVLDQHAVCARAGHHCAKPLMKELGVAATTRVSLYLYNDESDIDTLATALTEAGEMFSF